jgi:hypothetical protein
LHLSHPKLPICPSGKKYYISNKLVYDVDEDDNPDIEVGQIINGNVNLY